MGPSSSGGKAERRREERENDRARIPGLSRIWGLGRMSELALAWLTFSLIVHNPGL